MQKRGFTPHRSPTLRMKTHGLSTVSKTLPLVYPWEVYDKLKVVKTKKAPGPDEIPQGVLRDFACELSDPLCDILNTSFREGIVPSQWKEANVIPIPKSQPPTANQLRPISLTPQLSEIAEAFVATWVKRDITPNLDPAQFGSRPGRSATHALVSILHTLYKASDIPSTTSTLSLLTSQKHLIKWI